VVRVTQVFQNTQQFYIDACHVMANNMDSSSSASSSSGRRHSSYTSPYTSTGSTRQQQSRQNTSSPNSVIPEPPLEFHALHKWTQLKHVLRSNTPSLAVSHTELSYHMAYACLNYRGALVHGQAIDCTYQVPTNLLQPGDDKSVADVWQEAGFPPTSCRILKQATTQQIQHELWQNGPLVSTSFVLNDVYYQSTKHAGNFSHSHVGQPHALIVLGWTIADVGPVWLVQALRGPPFFLSMHQFQLEAELWAPSTTLLQTKSWQSPGPYWNVGDLNDKSKDWNDHFGHDRSQHQHHHKLPSLMEVVPLTSEDVEHLADLWTDGVGLHTVISERRTFVLRDARLQAQSRRVILRDISRVAYPDPKDPSTTKRVWKATLSAVRQHK